jgi:nitroimidazol reductase NimA-like FMN-containing flavoprotein (pyridoxamine 5'-phosphate oxidase superfamily)
MDAAHGVEDAVRKLIDSQILAVLSTQGARGPHACLVAFAVDEDLRRLYFATARSTLKFANILAHPEVALLIDNRTNRAADFDEAAAVTVTGTARALPDAERVSALTLYLGRHPHLEGFARAPACALVEVRVDRYQLVRRLQDVMVLEVEHGPGNRSG